MEDPTPIAPPKPMDVSSSAAAPALSAAAAVTTPSRADIYRGTGIAKRSGGRPLTEYIQKRRPSKSRAKKVVEVLDLGAKLGICRRCTCPVHEADITDGYAEKCADWGFECIQTGFADSCAEFAQSHTEEVAAARAADEAEGRFVPPPESEPAADEPPAEETTDTPAAEPGAEPAAAEEAQPKDACA